MGPLFALIKFLKELPPHTPLKFREGDYFKDFEQEVNSIFLERQEFVADKTTEKT